MTYATVMVSLALDQPNEARLEVAGQIAERFEAGIIGINISSRNLRVAVALDVSAVTTGSIGSRLV